MWRVTFCTLFEAIIHLDKQLSVSIKKLGGTHGIEVMVDSGKIDGIFDADFLRKLSELEDWLHSSQNGSIGASISVVDLFKELNFALVGKRQLPASTDEAHQLILLYESGGGDLKLFADKTNRLARLSVRARAEGTQKALALEAALLKKADSLSTLCPSPVRTKRTTLDYGNTSTVCTFGRLCSQKSNSCILYRCNYHCFTHDVSPA